MQQEHKNNSLTESQIEDLRLAAGKMSGAKRRAFQAQMCEKLGDRLRKVVKAKPQKAVRPR